MRWEIDSKAHGGLKVIPEIPDISPCLLEGRNGIGKTVAVQLLEMVSGQVPEDFRRHNALWSSLRARIGDTSITIDGLRDGRRIELTFTPDQWPTKPPETTADWLGSARLDGREATASECAALVSVTRIAGDEDLEKTLRRRVDTIKLYLRSAARELRIRGDAIDETLADLRPDLDRADPDELAADMSRLAQLEQQLKHAEHDAALADQRLQRLLTATEMRRRLEDADQQTKALLARRDELVARVHSLDGELQSKEKLAEAADSALASEGDASRTLSDAERLLRNRRSRLANLQRDVEDRAGALGVAPDQDAVATAVQVCDAELGTLQAQHQELDATVVVRDLISELITPLQDAQDGAGNQILIKNDKSELTVAQTLEGVGRRRQELVDQPEPAQLRDVINQIDLKTGRREQLVELASKLEQHEQARQRVEQAEAEATEAAKQVKEASEAAVRSREANQAVGAAEAELTDAHRELAEVQQQIGTSGLTSREDAETDLHAALSDLDLGEDDLADADRVAREALAAADHVVTELAASLSSVRRRVTTRRTDIDLLLDRLRDSQRYAWLLEATKPVAQALTNPEGRYVAFQQLRTALLHASDPIFETAQFLEGLVGTAETFFTETDEDQQGLVQNLRPAFETVLGHRLRESLNSPAIRKALFDGAEVVKIEPGTRQLLLRDADGNEFHRPMEAFSTGERAFAFTQARIADLEVSPKPNRLLVLDEFGAFVAADRFPELATFLASESTTRIADQVLVILPLHVDYQAEIADTRGALQERYSQRLEQINERDYCAVPLE